MTYPDFKHKKAIFISFHNGEKMSFSNENLIVKDKEGKIKLQCSCYNIFIIFAIGGYSITSVLIDKSQKFNFFIALMSTSFRLIELVGNKKSGNILLHKLQYNYNSLDIAKLIISTR